MKKENTLKYKLVLLWGEVMFLFVCLQKRKEKKRKVRYIDPMMKQLPVEVTYSYLKV